MRAKIATALVAVLLTGVLAFCCGYSSAVLMQTFTLSLGIVLIYGMLMSIFIDKWENIQNQKWSYWVGMGLALVGIVMSFLSTKFDSRVWTWIGYLVIIVGGVFGGLVSKLVNKTEEAPAEEAKEEVAEESETVEDVTIDEVAVDAEPEVEEEAKAEETVEEVAEGATDAESAPVEAEAETEAPSESTEESSEEVAE